MMRRLVAFCLLALLAGCSSAPVEDVEEEEEQVPVSTEPPSAERLAHLGRGINLSHWFAQTELNEARFGSWITAEDARLIKAMGFTHVRLSLDPRALFGEQKPGQLFGPHAKLLDRAVQMMLAEDLAVVIDLHPESAFKQRLVREDAFVEKVAAFWSALAARMSKYDPERVFLEVINEPEFENPSHWMRVQERLLRAMRRGAPEHTLIATGPNWSSVDDLLKLEPVRDRNVVYNFHLYEPHTFTHQGATWGWWAWRHFLDLPYPSSPEAVAPVLSRIDDTDHPDGYSARDVATGYGEERWGRAKLGELITRAAEWGRLHNVPLTCNEFGVYRLAAPPESRANYLHDARSLLEEHGIGWAMWDYAGGFSVVNQEGSGRTPDLPTVQALGLRPE